MLFDAAQEKSFAAAVEEQRRIMKEHGQDLSMDVLGEMDVLHRNIQGESTAHSWRCQSYTCLSYRLTVNVSICA